MSVLERPVVTRKVTRTFYNGKGYASLYAACRAKAKDLFKDLVYGPIVRGRYGVDCREKLLAVDWEPTAKDKIMYTTADFIDVPRDETEAYDHAHKRILSEFVAVHFPHDETCLRPYHCSTEPMFAGCKEKVDKWIKAKTRELMEAK